MTNYSPYNDPNSDSKSKSISKPSDDALASSSLATGSGKKDNLEKLTLDALGTIVDPDLNDDIVSLGFIKKLKIDGGNVSFSLELTTPGCPVRDQFQKDAEEKVRAIAGVEAVSVTMTSRPRVELDLHADSPLKKVDSIVAIASCKGGVGKSTVAALIASELAMRGLSVGLLDIDIFGPSLPTLFSLGKDRVSQKNGLLQPLEVKLEGSDDGAKLKVMSFGFLLGDNAAVMRGPMVSNYLQQILKSTDWGELDYLLLDLPPGTGDTQLTLTQRVQLSGAVMVTTEAPLSLADVSKGIRMFEKVNVPIYGLVNNMAYFKCQKCDNKHRIFSNSTTSETLSQRLGLPVIAELPMLPFGALQFNPFVAGPEVAPLVDELLRCIGSGKIASRIKAEVSLFPTKIVVKLSPEETFVFPTQTLRAACPCAVCVNEFTGERKIKPADIASDIHATSSASLGNYAISLQWSDGHSSGIYSFTMLRNLAKSLDANLKT